MARPSKHLMNVVAGLTLLFATAFGHADEANNTTDDQKDLTRLAAIWQGNLSEIESAHIQYRSLARSPSKITTRDAVLKLLEASDFVNRPDDARLLSKVLGLEIPPEHAAWGYGELYVTGNKTRINKNYEGDRYSEVVWTDAANIVFDRRNQQIDIYVRNGSRRKVTSLDDFRVIPRPQQQSAATIEKHSADGLVVKIGRKQFVVEKDTGFVQSVSEGSIQSDPQSREIFQKGRVAYPNGITLPAAVITCRYSRGELNFIGIDVIETATFNEPIEDDVFAVGAPTGSKVFDSRVNSDEPGYFTRIEAAVADVYSEINERRRHLEANLPQ